MSEKQLLSMKGISKAFPGVQALDQVDFNVNAGEVMAFVGENGAGKSTLVKILAGAHQADAGEIQIDGEAVSIPNPRESQGLGIAVIYQELELAEQLSVAENIFIGREFRTSLGTIDKRKLHNEAQKILDTLHIDVDPKTEVRKLSIAKKQMVEISRALSMDARIIIMDEPTSSLPTSSSLIENEVEVLFRVIEGLKARGKTVIYISHRMDEIFRISDRITVLRDGKLIGVKQTSETNPDQIISMMVGRELKDLYGHRGEINIGQILLELKDYGGVSFNVCAGEILGVAGLVGAGRTDLILSLLGAGKTLPGSIHLQGEEIKISSPGIAVNHGVGYVPEDRKLQGLFLEKSVCQNISISSMDDLSRRGFLMHRKEREMGRQFVEKLGIRTPSIHQLARNLSGGNQQKVVLAKWMAVNPKVLILDEPTRGVDVGAKAEIYELIYEMTRAGIGIVMISSELPEIIALSDRVVVMREGKFAGELSKEEVSEEKIMALATGVTRSEKNNA